MAARKYVHKDAIKRVPLTAWAATTAKIIGDTIKPTTGTFYLYCTGAGTTGGTEPVWGTPSYLDPFGDGTVVWEVRGTGEFDVTNPDRAAFDLEETLGSVSRVNGVVSADNIMLLQGATGEYTPTESLITVATVFISSASLVDGNPGEYHAVINLSGHSSSGFVQITIRSYIQRILLKNGGADGFSISTNDYIRLVDCVVLDCVGRPIFSNNGNSVMVDGFYTIGCTEGSQIVATTFGTSVTNSFFKCADNLVSTYAALTVGAGVVKNCIILKNGAATDVNSRAALRCNHVQYLITIKNCVIGFYGTPTHSSSNLFGIETLVTNNLYPFVADDCHFENIRNTDGTYVGQLVGGVGVNYWEAVSNCTGNNCDDIDDDSGLAGEVFWDVTAFDQGFEDPDNDDWTPTNDPTSYPFQKAIALEPDWMGTSPPPFGIGGGGVSAFIPRGRSHNV